jgi:hypothetical protein
MVTTSPVRSAVRARITLNDSLSATSSPRCSVVTTSGIAATRILRPPECTSTVSSSLTASTVP